MRCDQNQTDGVKGSFGAIPNYILERLRHYQTEAESAPDRFIFYDQKELLDETRAAVAEVINAPVETVVMVGNATEGVNTVLRNLVWDKDGKDVILSFSTIYEACGKAADYLVDYHEGNVDHRAIPLRYPLEDEDIVQAFCDTVKQIEAEGKRAKVCIFDVVSSRPGVVFPWQEMVKTCKDLGVISLVDGAQGIGMVHLDVSAADPDYFVSNCHKWLHVPRGCAVFYVPVRNQHLLTTTLATSHGYVPRKVKRNNPLPASTKGPFIENFEFVGTKDNAPYLCVKDAIAWRRDVLGGEAKILAYMTDLNKKGIKRVAEILGTEYLDNAKGTMTNCAMGNVALPVWIGEKGAGAKETDVVIPAEDEGKLYQWILKACMYDYKTSFSRFVLGGRFWIRISAQVYLDMSDYEHGGKVLKDMCERIGRGDYLKE